MNKTMLLLLTFATIFHGDILIYSDHNDIDGSIPSDIGSLEALEVMQLCKYQGPLLLLHPIFMLLFFPIPHL